MVSEDREILGDRSLRRKRSRGGNQGWAGRTGPEEKLGALSVRVFLKSFRRPEAVAAYGGAASAEPCRDEWVLRGESSDHMRRGIWAMSLAGVH